MPARSQSRNLWPFAKKKRVVLSKEELKRIGDTQRRAMEADLQRARGGSSASSHRGSSAPSRTATHTPSSVSYKGYTIKPTEDGESWVIPKLDRDSHFDTLKDAKAFLTSWKKNPNVAKKLVKTTQKGGKSVLKFYDTLQGQVSRITGVPRAIVGKLVGEKNPKPAGVPKNYDAVSIRSSAGDADDVRRALEGAGIPAIVITTPLTSTGRPMSSPYSVWTPKKTYRRAVKLAEQAYFARHPERNPTLSSYWVSVSGQREYFKDINDANAAAQAEANRTGKPAARNDVSGGKSIFYPKRQGNPGSFKITEVRYDRESNKTWAFVRTQQFSEWFSVSGHVAKSQLKGLLHHSVDKKLESFGVHPSDRLAKNKKGNPKNPQSGAEEMYESFHGKPAEGVTVVEEEFHEHEWLAPLGVLVNYRVATLSGFDVLIGVDDETAAEQDFDETAANAETIFLSANEDGTQIYFKGGDQSLPLDRFKMGESTDWYRDDMIIGVLYEITYRTKKKFDKFQLTDYFHHLGEETGDQPMLRYDPLSPHQYVSGGKYKIKMPLIGMSPGIEN